MPEIQWLYEKHKDDKTVEILTVDYDDELSGVRNFVTEKYTFPVLRDNGYVFKAPALRQMVVLDFRLHSLLINKERQHLLRGNHWQRF